MILYHCPIVSISPLKIGGVTLPASEDKFATGYYVDQDIDPERVWNVYLNGYVFTDGQLAMISNAAGYVQPGTPGRLGAGPDLPAFGHRAGRSGLVPIPVKERPNVGATARRSTEGESVSTEPIDAPPNVLQVIERFKRALPSFDRRGDAGIPANRSSFAGWKVKQQGKRR